MEALAISMIERNARFLSLDIIRGLAALSVLLSHWTQWTVAYAGPNSALLIRYVDNVLQFIWAGGGIHPGVVVFIVLSGFCIHLPQARDPSKLTQVGFWRSFAVRRAFRIAPVYWTALALGVVSVLVVGGGNSADKGALSGEIVFSVIGAAEIIRFIGISPNSLYPGNGPLSTVGVEMLLYASYPIFLYVHRRAGILALLGLGLMSYLGIVAARFRGVPPDFIHGTYFEFTLYWIIGAVSAGTYVNISRPGLGFVWIRAISILLIAVYFVAIHSLRIKGLHVVTTLVLALATGALLILLPYLEQMLKARAMKVGTLLATIGERSYSLYVIHTPIIFIGIALLDTIKLAHGIYPWITLMLVFLSTEALHRLVEKPSHRYARSLRLL